MLRIIVVLFLIAMPAAAQERAFWIETPKGPEASIVPGILRSDVTGAVEMRFGNTPQEASLSDWLSYAGRHYFLLRGEATGDGTGAQYPMSLKRVFAEYRLADGTVLKMSAIQPSRDENVSPSNVLFPRFKVGDARATDYIILSEFTNWQEHWASYNDWPYYGNIFWPWSHSTAGGVNDSGHIWTDDSRWNVDAPETPNTVLVGLVYWKWISQVRIVSTRDNTINLSNIQISVSLNGDNLDLKGATVHFWVETDGGRWHATSAPLTVGAGVWADNTVTPSSATWTRTYDRYGTDPSLDLDVVTSWGFSFMGFPRGNMPTGVLRMDNFAVKTL